MRATRNHRILRTGGQRIAWTNTSRVPDADWLAALRLVAAEIDLDRCVVHWKAHGDYRRTWGRAYPSIPAEASLAGLNPREWRYLIIATDHGADRLTADAVATLAHEAKHVEQFRRGTWRREARARNVEKQARAFGSWLAEKWEAQR